MVPGAENEQHPGSGSGPHPAAGPTITAPNTSANANNTHNNEAPYPNSSSAFEAETHEETIFHDVDMNDTNRSGNVGVGSSSLSAAMDRIGSIGKSISPSAIGMGMGMIGRSEEQFVIRLDPLLAANLSEDNGNGNGNAKGNVNGIVIDDTMLSPVRPDTPDIRQRQGTSMSPSNSTTFLTSADYDTIHRLDKDYERALILREISWNAQYMSVRQNSGLTLWSFIVFILVGTIFFQIHTDWSLSQSILFSIYTITTVGYGNHYIPVENNIVLIFICIYIFLGIAMLTIFAAQLYQWLVLELTWKQYEKDSKEIIKRHKQNKKTSEELERIGEMPPSTDLNTSMTEGDGNGEGEGAGPGAPEPQAPQRKPMDKAFDASIHFLNKVQAYIRNNPAGQLVVVMVPFLFLIFLGALVVGLIEGWTFMESVYFGVVSMTTVGYGDRYPEKLAATWFCILWLPFSVGFLSLYLGSIARLYLHLSERNVKRIRRNLTRNANLERDRESRERAEAIARGTSAGFDLEVDAGNAYDDDNGNDNGDGNVNTITGESGDAIPSHLQRQRQHEVNHERRNGAGSFNAVGIDGSMDLGEDEFHDGYGTPDRRKVIISNSGLHVGGHRLQRMEGNDLEGETQEAMKTMRDMIAAVHLNLATPRRAQDVPSSSDVSSTRSNISNAGSDILNVKSTTHYTNADGVVEKKPTVALRVLLQERIAYIIAHEIAGYQSHVEIKNNTLSVTIDSLKHTADKWFIPRRARKTFRAVAFEVLYFCGERSLIVHGAQPVFDLRPHEVQSLFAPLLAAFTDADTMEAWLMRTQTMADNELHEVLDEAEMRAKLYQVQDRRDGKISDNLTARPNMKRNVIGNAVANQT